MRTTVTLAPDVAALIAKRMRETGASTQPSRTEVRVPVRNLGAPTVDLDKALGLAALLEDEEIVRKTFDHDFHRFDGVRVFRPAG